MKRKTKKENGLLGVLHLIDPCVQLESIVSYLETNGVSQMTASDWDKLQLLVNRCTMESAELAIRTGVIMQRKGN